MKKKPVRFATLLFSCFEKSEMRHSLETFINILPEFRKFSERDDVVAQLGDSGISSMYGRAFRCRHEIKRLLAQGMEPGNDLFVCALGMRGELNMQQLLNYGLAKAMRSKPDWTSALRKPAPVEKPTPKVTHNVGKTLH